MKSPTSSTSLRIITSGLIALALTAILFISKTQAIPTKINSYSACPPQSNDINVWLDEDNSPTGEAIVRTIPFDSGTRGYSEWIPSEGAWRWVEYDNYLRGVLAAEVGGPEWNTETLRAKAILARTVVYHRCGNNAYGSGYFEQGQRGVPGQVMQEYRYNKISTFTTAEQTRYQQAVDFGNDPYITYGGNTFDVQYRDKSKEWTNGTAPPHQGIYDPAGLSHSSEQSKTGFMQINADHWADGMRPSNIAMPPYDARRLLAHYYTAIGFVGLNPAPPNDNDYRFNVLEFAGMDDRRNDPLILRLNEVYSGSSYRRFPFIVQNTGDNPWYLACGSDYAAALGLHWYRYPDYAPVRFEGTRQSFCPSGGGTLQLQPGQEFPSQLNSNQQLYAYIVVNVPKGDYWLSLDMEFKPPNNQVWGSRLTPSGGYAPQWPSQNVRIQVIDSQPPVPFPEIDSGHSSGHWFHQRQVRLSWPAVNDPLLHHYRVCWDKRNSSTEDDCQNVNSTSFARTFTDGRYDLEVTAVAGDNKESEDALINDLRIDGAFPTAWLNALPVRVQAPDHVLNWNIADTGGSGLQQQQLTYQINNDANWRSVSAVSNDVNMRSIRFYFPEGQHGDVYEFCLRSLDGAGNWSVPSCRSTTYNPDPQLYVNPLQISVTRIYTDTAPTTQTIRVENHGGDVLNWTATTPFTLAAISPSGGTAPTDVTLTLTHPVGITATYVGYITVTATTPGTHNSPERIRVEVKVVERLYTYYLPLMFKQ